MLLSIHRKNPLFAQNIHELLQLRLSLNPSIRLAHFQIGIFIYEAEFKSRIVQQGCNLRLIWMRIQIILCYQKRAPSNFNYHHYYTTVTKI